MNTLFPIDPLYPEGFSYTPDFISREEEEALLEVVRHTELHTFVFQGYEAKRKVASFGMDYSFERGQLTQGAPIPPAFRPLVQRVAAHIGIPEASIAELLVTEYPPGAHITWHRDAPPFGLIAGVSLKTDCTFRLRPYEEKDRTRKSTRTLQVARRSLYVMQGPSRSAWQHSIAAVSETRYSITLRTLA